MPDSDAAAHPKPPAAIRLEGIPADLQTLPRWVVWKYALRDGNWKKPPYDAKTGTEANITDPATWSTFAQALAAFQLGGYDGLGFALAPADGISGIDFDDCVVDGVVDPAVLDTVRALDSYSELSPSGTGLHVFVRGTVPGPRCKNHARGIEMYSASRYFTVTGLGVDGTPAMLAPRQSELDALYQELFPPETEREGAAGATARPAQPVSLADETLIKAMLRRPAIAALWRGDLSAYADTDQPGGNPSRADLALCAHLAFYTGRDAERMDRLFRQSGLYRAKWQQAKYRQRTITKAIQSCEKVYDPRHRPETGASLADEDEDVDATLQTLADFGPSSAFGCTVKTVGCVRWVPVQQTYMALLHLARQERRLRISPGLHGLAQAAALGKSSVRRHLDMLQAAGLIALARDDHLTVTLIVAQRDTGSTPPTRERVDVPLAYDSECYLDHLQDDAFARPHHAHTQRRMEVGLAVEASYGAAGRLVVCVLARQQATRAQIAAATGASAASIRDATIELEKDGLILAVATTGRTGRAKVYALHPDFDHRLDALRPRLCTAGIGQMRVYRSQKLRADYYDRQVQILDRLDEPDREALGKLIAKRDRADRAALAAFENLKAMGIDPRRNAVRPPDAAGELDASGAVLRGPAAQADLEAARHSARVRFVSACRRMEQMLSSGGWGVYELARDRCGVNRAIEDLINLGDGPQPAAEANA